MQDPWKDWRGFSDLSEVICLKSDLFVAVQKRKREHAGNFEVNVERKKKVSGYIPGRAALNCLSCSYHRTYVAVQKWIAL
jgi:hypothetical protein